MSGAGRVDRAVDVLVVGAGPAGLALAARLAGTARVEVLEREEEAGGVPRHCPRGGFGARALPLEGPEYARRSVCAAVAAGAVLRTGVTATGWAGPLALEVTGPAGLERITARAVVLATGARERPRSARLVPGSRPAGVLTTGELQQSVHLYGQDVGRRAVVVGGEPVTRHAVRTLLRAGTEVAAVVTERPDGFAVPGIPVLTRTSVVELRGRGRLSGVAVRHGDGRTDLLDCDAVVFTGDWIPDHELARRGGIPLDPGTRGPAVDACFRTAVPGVFAVGNALRGIERARTAAAEGTAAADPVRAHLAGGPWPAAGPPLVLRSPLVWATPNRLTWHRPAGPAPRRPLLLRAAGTLRSPVVTVSQDGRVLWRRRFPGRVPPYRSVRLPEDWAAGVDPAGGAVVLGAG
ncbi:FAD-dependent oxidoreductase [Streptomyces sp. NPDC047014]|uniref:NAD(P)/FAD-dependent oxidoreductase n=1 Tax=Streptomyces sp. NPDC047014 TaxID=3155736 RepID=UPI0033E2C88B